MILPPYLTPERIDDDARRALEEDLGSGDISARLIEPERRGQATLITREAGRLCGTPWFDAVFRILDPEVRIDWLAADGDAVRPGEALCHLEGRVRSLLTGERTAMNFLQTLSGTASVVARCVAHLEGRRARLLDTRKTLPGLRHAQKYAVLCGGGSNHRIGLHDAFLIKENHISACGGIAAAVARAREIAPGQPVEVEVEDLEELSLALESGCERIMLDNFDLASLRAAVSLTAGRAELEASGNIDRDTLARVADTGVDLISSGALTKHVVALDLSMRLGEAPPA